MKTNESCIIIDEATGSVEEIKTIVVKFEIISGKGNEAAYEFAVELAKLLNTQDFKKLKISKSQFLEDLGNNSNIHYNDAGHLRQVALVGNLVINEYDGDISKLKGLGFGVATTIARSKLIPALNKKPTPEQKQIHDEENTKKQITIIEDVINKQLPPGKVQAQINNIKDDLKTELDKMVLVYNNWAIVRLDSRFGMLHNGQIPGQLVLNTLYHFCPKDGKVLDPMAGGGTTHDVCQWLNENGYNLKHTSFDLEPRNHDDHLVVEDRADNYINQRDRSFIIKKDVLKEEWDSVDNDLVFLDPPYYSMVKDGYPANEFTRSLDSFYIAIELLLQKTHVALRKGGIVALIMQPQTTKDLPDGENYIDLPYECMKIMENVGFKPWQRIQTPLTTEQFLPQQVIKHNEYEHRGILLGTSRDLIIMKKM